MNKQTLNKIAFGLFIIVLMASCSSYKKLTYLQNIPITGADSALKNQIPEYKLQSSDMLYVKFITQNEKLNSLFNPSFSATSTYSTTMSESGMYYLSYIVDDSGYVDLPMLKKIKVANITIKDAQKIVQDSALKYFNDVQVILKMGTMRFTLLGEVKIPGVKTTYDTKIDILEALAYGGDISYNGNRQKILVLRTTDQGIQTFRIDVTKGGIVNEKKFYIFPNDIVYIEPLKTTLFRERVNSFVFLIPTIATTITTIILLLNYIK